jgi:hypothetical protein
MLVLLAVAFVLLICFSIVIFFYLQLGKKKPSQIDKPDLSSNPNLGTCAKCQQQRIIVKKEANLCAFCWSSLYTKQSG